MIAVLNRPSFFMFVPATFLVMLLLFSPMQNAAERLALLWTRTGARMEFGLEDQEKVKIIITRRT